MKIKNAVVAGVLALGVGASASAIAQEYSFVELTLGGSVSTGKGINDSGQVVGLAYTAGDKAGYATAWNANTATDFSPGVLASYSVFNGINNSGQVTGQMTVQLGGSNWGWRATIWNGGVPTVLGALPGTTHNDAQAINSSGQVAGRSIIDPFSGHYHATVWNGTTPTDLGIDSGAYGINDVGHVVGSRNLSGGLGGLGTHATIWNGTTATDLGTLGGNYSEARAINNSGLVVGYSSLFGETASHATLWNGTTATDLGTLGGQFSAAYAINDLGDVVGYSWNANNAGRATLWKDGVATDLNSFLDASTISSGWVLTDAYGINDNGWIIGNATNSITGEWHAFALTTLVTAPVPEPETYAMMLAGLGLLGVVARRRKQKLNA